MSKNENSIKALATLAMLCALSIVLGKYLQIPVGDTLRFSFENLPIIFAGIAFGPVSGALVGVTSDLIGCLLVGYTINPILTLAAGIIGVLSGVIWRLADTLPRTARALLSIILPHIFGSVVLKSFGLALFFSQPLSVTLLLRLFNYIVVGSCESVILCMLLKSRALISAVLKIRGGSNDL